jgi:Leucine-rich repeat (LRR) protein
MLTQLQKLDLDSNNFTHLPKEIGNLTQLKELTLKNNKLIDLPQEIGNLILLHKLDVSHNRLKKLPATIVNVKLKIFEVKGNPFNNIPDKLLGVGFPPRIPMMLKKL